MKEYLHIKDVLDLPKIIMDLLNSLDRDLRFNEIIELYKGDLSYDWFQDIYEEELAQRNQNKQDFTPNIVGVLLSRLTGFEEGKIYEPTAGNGSLIITNWNHRIKTLGEKYIPEGHPVECWELSDRSIPILLFNLSIRGIVGVVNHGNVLTKQIKQSYYLKRIKESNYSLITKQQ